MERENMYGFTVQNWKAIVAGFPIEDAFNYDETDGVACVSDLVTRDFSDGSVVTHDLNGLIKALSGKYPDYSEASREVVNSFLETRSLETANSGMLIYNTEHGLIPTNYLDRDLASCTAAGIFEEEGLLHWQFIADSGVAVVRNGELVFKTPDEGPHSAEKNPYLEEVLKRQGGFVDPEGRRVIRSQYRNNPLEPFSYGVLTGEQEALHYITEGIEKLEVGDYVLIFTDGIGNILIDGEKIKEEYFELISNGTSRQLERLCKRNVSTEGTLVVWKIE